MEYKEKKINIDLYKKFIHGGLHPVLSSLFSARNIKDINEVDYQLDKLLAPELLVSNLDAGEFLMHAINNKKNIIVVGDYDTDGATATACAVLGLRKFGAIVDFIVPNRFEFGYGLTPEIVKLAAQRCPDVIVTVDNGVASISGVEAANDLGIDVLITDHHLPGDQLPNARYIVNPNQKLCTFPSKNLCGVGVMFYVLLSVRAAFRKCNTYKNKEQPILSDLLDLVALGTIADLVNLDLNNRILIKFGLDIIKTGKCNFGIKALINLTKKQPSNIKTSDLSFMIAPKLNAAGRLDDMTLGIQCLIADDIYSATTLAKKLIHLNEQRKFIENEMKETAMSSLTDYKVGNQFSIVMFDKSWHQGVIGILASRLKEKYYRPIIIFAKGENGFLKGSGRSILSYHLRDALDTLTKRYPDLIKTFGGHAMAAGLTIREENFDEFCKVFEGLTKELLNPEDLNLIIEIDKPISSEHLNYKTAKIINNEVWGMGFPFPIFLDTFDVIQQKIIASKHSKCILRKKNNYEAIFFNYTRDLPDRITITYSIEANEFNNNQSLQLIIRNLIHD